jgi:hypothetical protein
MIETNPYLFNGIAAFFIAFTSGWIVFVIRNKQVSKLKKRIQQLETEMLDNHSEILHLEEQLFTRYKSATASVISFNSTKAGNAGK